MVQISINIYKVIIRYTFEGEYKKNEVYFMNLEKALKYAEEKSKLLYVAIHELGENENGELVPINCIKVYSNI